MSTHAASPFWLIIYGLVLFLMYAKPAMASIEGTAPDTGSSSSNGSPATSLVFPIPAVSSVNPVIMLSSVVFMFAYVITRVKTWATSRQRVESEQSAASSEVELLTPPATVKQATLPLPVVQDLARGRERRLSMRLMSKLGLDNKTRPRSRSVGFPVSDVGRESRPPTPLPPSFQEPTSTPAHPSPRPIEHGALIDFSSPEVLEGRLIDYESSSSSHIWAMDLEFPSRSSISGSPIRPPSRASSPRPSLSQHSRAPSLVRREYMAMPPAVGASPLALTSFPTLHEPKASSLRTSFLVDFPRQDDPPSGVLVDVSEPTALPTPPWETIQLVDVSDHQPLPLPQMLEAPRGLEIAQPSIFEAAGSTQRSNLQRDRLHSSLDFPGGARDATTEQKISEAMTNYDEAELALPAEDRKPEHGLAFSHSSPHHVQDDLDLLDDGDDTLVAEDPIPSVAENKTAMNEEILAPGTAQSTFQSHSMNYHDSHDNLHSADLAPAGSELLHAEELSLNVVSEQPSALPSPVSETIDKDYSFPKPALADEEACPTFEAVPDAQADIVDPFGIGNKDFPDPELPSLPEFSMAGPLQSPHASPTLAPNSPLECQDPDPETTFDRASVVPDLASEHEDKDSNLSVSTSPSDFPDPELPVIADDTLLTFGYQQDPELYSSSELEAGIIENTKRPAWSIRASDAPPLGLTASNSSNPGTPIKVVPNPAKEEETATPPPLFKPSIEEVEETDIPGSFPEPGATEDSEKSMSSAVQPAKATAHRRAARSPIDIALAMQLRPGIGLGSDPAWMVRFLMSMFGWFVVTLSGSGNFERYAPTDALTN